MARGSIAMQVSGMMANPYPAAREQIPKQTQCELCDRVIRTSDWASHKASKKHRAAEEAEKDANKVAANNNHSTFDHGGNDFADFNAASTFGDVNSGLDGAWDTNFNNNCGHAAGGGGNDRACYGCGQPGHTKRECPQGGGNGCFNCGESGHRKNECPNPRKPMGGGGGGDRLCYNCNQPGHTKSDCPQGPAARTSCLGRPCFNCGEEGHMSKDCINPRVIKCRNCDHPGHVSKECPEPTDWSRVKCNNCQQFGHTVKRCREPPAEANDGSWGNSGGDAGGAASGGWGDDAQATSGATGASGSWADDSSAAAGGWGEATAEW